jgi:hypothetical protein
MTFGRGIKQRVERLRILNMSDATFAAAYATLSAVGMGMVMFGLLYAIALDAKP